MNNYSTINEILKEETKEFIKKLTKGLGKVDTHFVSDMVIGILKNNTVLLSDIVRGSGNRNIKKGVERLERHLDRIEEIRGIIKKNYEEMIKSNINKRKLYFVDRSEIVKEEKTKFENKGNVFDGSDSHIVKKGYQINEIGTIDHNNQPINLVSELRSSKDEEYLTENELWTKHMEYVKGTYGEGTFIMDRGYDGKSDRNGFRIHHKSEIIR